MLTLALDTTTREGSVAVVRAAVVLAVVYGDATRTHGERLPSEIDRALQQAGITASDLELLAVASGPGAFTGLRIGLATIQGLAMVLNVPVIAVSALDALALSVASTSPGPVPEFGDRSRNEGQPLGRGTAPGSGDTPRGPWIAAWMDAARGEVFAAYYAAGHDPQLPEPAAVPIVATPDVALASMSDVPAIFVGDGAVRYSAQILQHSGDRPRVVEPPPALAPFVARIGIARAARGDAGPPHGLQPLYVRRSDAELERQRREVR